MNPHHCLLQPSTERRSAFTLLELLAVLVVLALLASILAPALARTKPGNLAAQCLNNQRQLIIAWQMYGHDNNDCMPYNFHGGGTGSGGTGPYGWGEGWLDWSSASDNTNINLLTGSQPSLGAYVAKASLYKCPADVFLSPTQRALGWTARVRSVSGNIYLGPGNVSQGATDPIYKQQLLKVGDLRFPAPSQTWVFLEEHPDSINDPAFFAPHQTSWIDLPAGYHDDANTVAFADAHVETHKWGASLTSIRIRSVAYADLGGVSVSSGDLDVEWLAYRTPRVSPTFTW